MSAKNRGTIVKANEFYPTPANVTKAMLENIDFSFVFDFCEPCVGDGAIYNLIPLPEDKKYWYEITKGRNYFGEDHYLADVILTMTNPPFSLAEAFIIKALSHSRTVIMLLRVNFMGSTSRLAFWKEAGLKQINIITPRPAFYGKCTAKEYPQCKEDLYPLDYAGDCLYCGGNVSNQTDATEYAWFVFGDDDCLIDKSPFRWLETNNSGER